MSSDWLIPAQVTAHQMNKWQAHARERLDLAAKYLTDHNIAIQAGGNLGIWPYLLVEEYGFRQVHTLEPDPDNLECLRANTGAWLASPATVPLLAGRRERLGG